MLLKKSLVSFHRDTKSVGKQIRAGFPKNFGSHTPLALLKIMDGKKLKQEQHFMKIIQTEINSV